MVWPPPPEHCILRQVESLGRLVVEIAHGLMKLKHGQSELSVGHPLALNLHHLSEFGINLELQIALDGDVIYGEVRPLHFKGPIYLPTCHQDI